MVVARHGMDHLDAVDEVGDAVQHAYGVVVVQGPAQLLQCVEVLEVVLCLVGGVSH